MKIITSIIIGVLLSMQVLAQETNISDFELELQKLEKGEWVKEEKQIQSIEALSPTDGEINDQVSTNQAAIVRTNSNELENSKIESKKMDLKPRRVRSR